MQLRKVKRPQGDFFFEVQPWAEDEFGTWFFAPSGAPWVAPHAVGALGFDLLLVLHPERPWIAWWIDDPDGRYIAVDICLPPVREQDGWAFVDLELDPIRHASGAVVIDDRDEFETAIRDGWISPADAMLAEATAVALAGMLTAGASPFGADGWDRLDAAQRAWTTAEPRR